MIKILFGSQTGNARNLAHVIGTSLESHGFSNEVLDMSEVPPEEIQDINYLMIVTSTYGDGEAPDNASEWYSFLKFEEVDLAHLKYAVIGLGDPYYPHFCQCGKDFDQYLSKNGGQSLIQRLDCDRYYEEQYGEWLEKFILILKNQLQE